MDYLKSSMLSVNGGSPVRNKPWVQWPQYTSQSINLIQKVFESGRWAVSGMWTGEPPFDQIFAKQFAEYLKVKYCVPTDHGSSALVIAMKALGIGAGDEVIVPGLTWVACASAVLRLGAVPILVDIEPDTLCLSPNAVSAAITSRTAAILVVHLYSAMAQMDELTDISKKNGIPIIEDCAHVHGASWNGRPAGSLTEIGAFSMQQGKVLTCGEGGAVVTSDDRLFSLIEQLRNDGRRYTTNNPELGQIHLQEVGLITGANLAMSEFQSAILLDGLSRLEEQNIKRKTNAEYLDSELSKLGALECIRPYAQNDKRTYYHYVIRYDPADFAGRDVDAVCRALEAELKCCVRPTYRPLNDHPLYRPQADVLSKLDSETRQRMNPTRFELPEADRQHKRSLLFHHPVLLGTPDDMNDIIAAFEKVRRLADTITVS